VDPAHAPPKLILLLVAKLKEKMVPQQFEVLKEFHTLVVKYLTTKDQQDKGELHTQLVSRVPQLKSLVRA
jgi:hypothetical protein